MYGGLAMKKKDLVTGLIICQILMFILLAWLYLHG